MPAWGVIRKYEKELGERGRVLVRSSGTEPVERIMVEAVSKRKAEEVAHKIADAIIADLDR